MDFEKHEQEVLEERANTYEKKFGEGALIEAVRDQTMKYSHYGKDDYIDITYKEGEEVKQILLVGDVLKIGEYILAKISQISKMTVIRRANGEYFPMVVYEEGEFL